MRGNRWVSGPARLNARTVTGSASDDNTYKRPAFTVVNLGLDYDVTEKSEIALRVYNVFDEIYATSGGTTQWQLAPPRTGEVVYRVKY